MLKRKLLLADDSITIQKVVNLTFADEGIEVISVGDGDSAMIKIGEYAPDLIWRTLICRFERLSIASASTKHAKQKNTVSARGSSSRLRIEAYRSVRRLLTNRFSNSPIGTKVSDC